MFYIYIEMDECPFLFVYVYDNYLICFIVCFILILLFSLSLLFFSCRIASFLIISFFLSFLCVFKYLFSC